MTLGKSKNQKEKWDEMFKRLLVYSLWSRFEPSEEDYQELASWYKAQKSSLKNGELSEHRRKKIETVHFELSAYQKKWMVQFEQLIYYRLENPNSWPIYDNDNQDSDESKMAVFCQIVRERYRKKKLEAFWIDRFASIDFNFEARKENWLEWYNRIKEVIQDKEIISNEEISQNNYDWMYRNNKYYEENKTLSKHQRELIKELNLKRFFETWDTRFEKVKDWVSAYGKFPTPKENKELNSWLDNQKSRYKSGTLDESQIRKLKDLGFEFIGMGKEEDELRWKKQFKTLELFRKLNPDRWPSYYGKGEERKLYIWCQSQRQIQSGTLKGRKSSLPDWKVTMLNSIGFNWSKDEIQMKLWLEIYNKLKTFLKDSTSVKIPTKINGKTNPLYHWVISQRQSYRKGNYDEEKYLMLRELGIDLNQKNRKNPHSPRQVGLVI
jgi:hypothetical protein